MRPSKRSVCLPARGQRTQLQAVCSRFLGLRTQRMQEWVKATFSVTILVVCYVITMTTILCFSVGCDCRGGHCDPRTGECRCADGMTGKQCDTCTHKYSIPVEQHNVVHCEGQRLTHTRTHTRIHFFHDLCDCFQCVTVVSSSCWRILIKWRKTSVQCLIN